VEPKRAPKRSIASTGKGRTKDGRRTEDGAEAKHSINSGGPNKRRQLGKAKPKALPKRDIASTQEEQADDDRRTAKAKRIINSGRPNRPPKQSILSKGSISGRDGVQRRIGVCVCDTGGGGGTDDAIEDDSDASSRK